MDLGTSRCPTIFVVMFSVGEYSYRSEYSIAAYCDEDAAKRHVRRAERLRRVIWKIQDMGHQDRMDTMLDRDHVTVNGKPLDRGRSNLEILLARAEESAERHADLVGEDCWDRMYGDSVSGFYYFPVPSRV